MNIIGIEYRRIVTALGVREGDFRPHPVGDGRRLLIPNAVLPDGLWGSDAAAQPNGQAWSLNPAQDGFGPAASPFWSGIRRRLTAFLGGIDPVEHDYRVVVALGDMECRTSLAALAREAGFNQAAIISAPQAALAGWLAQQPPTDGGERTIAVATLGDVSVEVGAFVVHTQAVDPIVAAADPVVLRGLGASYVVGRFLNELASLLPVAPPSHLMPVLWQLALEFGDRLRRAEERTLLRWHGPLQENLVTPLQLSRQDVAAWSEFQALADALPDALHQAVSSVRRPRADVLLVAGMGACWPLPPAAFSGLPTPLVSECPALDIALGATYWPLVCRAREAPMYPLLDGDSPYSLALPNESLDEEFSASPAPLPGGLSADEFTQMLDEIQDDSSCSEASHE